MPILLTEVIREREQQGRIHRDSFVEPLADLSPDAALRRLLELFREQIEAQQAGSVDVSEGERVIYIGKGVPTAQ